MRPLEARDRAWEDRPRLSRESQERFLAAAKEATRFFMGEADVYGAQQKIARLLADLEEELDPYVREKYRELWQAAQVNEVE